MSENKKFSLEEIKEAGKRIDRSCKGGKEKYNEHLLEIMEAISTGAKNDVQIIKQLKQEKQELLESLKKLRNIMRSSLPVPIGIEEIIQRYEEGSND